MRWHLGIVGLGLASTLLGACGAASTRPRPALEEADVADVSTYAGAANLPKALREPASVVAPTPADPPALRVEEAVQDRAEAAPPRRRHVVLIGDSTLYCLDGAPDPRLFEPGGVVEALLPTLVSEDHPLHDARVHNLAIGASATVDWVEQTRFCAESGASVFPIMKHCKQIHRFLDGVRLEVPDPDVIVLTLGVNDGLEADADPKVTADRLQEIRDYFAPTPVYLAPPFAVDASATRYYPFSVALTREIRARHLADFEYPELPRRDKVHLDRAGCVMAGARIAAFLAAEAKPLRDAPPPSPAGARP